MPATWEITELDQTVLADLPDRQPGATIEIGRHTARLASVTLGGFDTAGTFASVGDTVLRVMIDGWTDPLFCGRINTRSPSLNGDDSEQQISAADPLTHLSQSIVAVLGSSPTAYNWADYGSQQPDDLIASLITDFAPDAGIDIGLTPGGATARDGQFALGTTVLDAVLSLTGMDDSVEFELTPTEATDGTLVTFNAFYPQQGSDLSASVEVKIGVDETDNATDFSYEEALTDLVNRHYAISDSVGTATKGSFDYPYHLIYIASHAASIAQYGVFASVSSHSGVTESSFLEDYAKALVAANAYPIGDFSVTLDPTAAIDFSPDGDFWIGDVVSVTAGLPEETLDLTGRVAAATFTEQENGEFAIDIAFEIESDVAGVTGTLSNALTGVASDGSAVTVPEAPASGGARPPKPTSNPGKGLKWVWREGQGWVRVQVKKKKNKKSGLD